MKRMEKRYTGEIGDPDTYRAEEFAGFDGFGEFPEFKPPEEANPLADAIASQIRERLKNDDMCGARIEVVVENGAVVLRGSVRTGTQESSAGHFAREFARLLFVLNQLLIIDEDSDLNARL
jgi:BON domain